MAIGVLLLRGLGVLAALMVFACLWAIAKVALDEGRRSGASLRHPLGCAVLVFAAVAVACLMPSLPWRWYFGALGGAFALAGIVDLLASHVGGRLERALRQANGPSQGRLDGLRKLGLNPSARRDWRARDVVLRALEHADPGRWPAGTDWEEAEAAAHVLVAWGEPHTALDAVMRVLRGDVTLHTSVILAALRALGPEAAPRLIRFVEERGGSSEALGVAIDALGRLGASEAAPALIDVARKVSGARSGALWALAAIGDARAADVALEALDDPDVATQRAAMAVAGRLRLGTAVSHLIAGLERAETHAAAAGALGAVGDRLAVEPLRRWLKERSQASAKALAEMGWKPEAPGEAALMGVLTRDWKAVAAAGPAAAPALVDALRDSDVGQAATSAAEDMLRRHGPQLDDATLETLATVSDVTQSAHREPFPLPVECTRLNALAAAELARRRRARGEGA